MEANSESRVYEQETMQHSDVEASVPVSYTHLDVYKRQDEMYAEGRNSVMTEEELLLLLEECAPELYRELTNL